jgi:hypothetical protein
MDFNFDYEDYLTAQHTGQCMCCGTDTEPILEHDVIFDDNGNGMVDTTCHGHEVLCDGCQDMLQQRAADLECLESHEEYTDDNLPF